MSEKQILEMAINFIKKMQQLEITQDVFYILHPENIKQFENEIIFKSELKQTDKTGELQTYQGYSAPEVYKNEHCPQSNVYFVGAVLHKIMTGNLPEKADERKNSIYFVQKTPLTEIVKKALELDKYERYYNLNDFLNTLEIALLNEEKSVVGQQQSSNSHFVQEAERPAPPMQNGYGAQAQNGYGAQAQNGYGAPVQNGYGAQAQKTYGAPPMGGAYYNNAQLSGGMPMPLQLTQEQKNKRKKKRIIIISILIIIFAIIGTFIVYTFGKKNEMNNAIRWGEFKEANSAFEKTPWLKIFASDEYNYNQGQLFLEEGKAKEGLESFRKVFSFNKAEVDDLVQKLKQYLEAENSNDAVVKFELYDDLGNFLDATEKKKQEESKAFEIAIKAYKEERLAEAASIILKLEENENTRPYIRILTMWQDSYSTGERRTYLEEIKKLAEVIDIVPVVMSNEFFSVFMEGKWNSDDGGGAMLVNEIEFEMTKLDLPEGGFSFSDKTISMDGVAYYRVIYVSFNEVVLSDAKNDTKYTFTR